MRNVQSAEGGYFRGVGQADRGRLVVEQGQVFERQFRECGHGFAGTAFIRAAKATAFQLCQVFQAGGSLVGEPGMGKPQAPRDWDLCDRPQPIVVERGEMEVDALQLFQGFQMLEPGAVTLGRGQPQDAQLGQASDVFQGVILDRGQCQVKFPQTSQGADVLQTIALNGTVRQVESSECADARKP